MADVLRFPAAAERTTALLGDAAARAQALDVRASCIVEAPAGSGKTGLLVQRYLKLLGDESVEQPGEVLAITFTNKATAELRERVLEQLREARTDDAAESLPEFVRQTRELAKAVMARSSTMGWRLLEQPQQLNIRSIDSVCAEIANSLPLLSGGGGARQPVEDARPLYRMAARRTLLQLGGKDAELHAALRTVLLHRDGNLRDCEMLLAGMLESREQWGELVPLGSGEMGDARLDTEVRLRLERSLEGVVCAGLSRAMRAMPAGMLEELTSLAAKLGFAPGYRDAVSPIAICAGRHEPPEATADCLEHWLALVGLLVTNSGEWRAGFNVNHVGFAMDKKEKALLKQLIDEAKSDKLKDALCAVQALPPARYPDEQWAVAKALFQVLRRTLAELKVLFAERGECDFTEFALAAREALRAEEGATDLAMAAGGRLRHLLVDEMQDTSSGQYELLELLTRSWDGHTQTLFLVGDPKQSIYLFRQARVERFLRTMQEQRLGEIRLMALRLTANFRSQGALVEDFNDTFERLFPLPEDESLRGSEGVDVPFVAASAVRERTGDEGVMWHAAVIAEEEREGYPAQEAGKIRRLIEERRAEGRARGEKPLRIAVLGRARQHLAALMEEFKRDAGEGPLPFRAVDMDALDELPEVLDALALTRALLHPADKVAWLAVLHAPWCGLGLADLLRLAGEEDEVDATIASLVRSRRTLLSAEGQRLLERAWPVLERALATLGRSSLAVHVERTWRSLGGDAALTEEQRENVRRYFGVLREVEGEGGVELEALQARLKRLYAEPIASASDEELPVELMTIHKAKGLEWDVVFVPGLERGGGRSTSVLLNWLEFDGGAGDEASVVLAPIWQKGTDRDKLSAWLNRVRANREVAERKRVFYVATTRAREELHLFAAATRNEDGELTRPKHDSLLNACWPAAVEKFERSEAALQDRLLQSLELPESFEDLALAAVAEEDEAPDTLERVPRIQRLPLSFKPEERFRKAEERRLNYGVSPVRQAAFERPEGSFAVRAFGNVVHRYLQVLAERLAAGVDVDALRAELPGWEARLVGSLRGEGLPPAVAAREASRALLALTKTMADPVGLWVLSPQQDAASERALTMAAGAGSLRVDRTFAAGEAPLSGGSECIWIVDFKTTEQGSRSDAVFEAGERAKYSAQLEAYAALRRKMPDGTRPIRLGLFYPLVPRLIGWESTAAEV
jgi:ATP-dependent helicase/nuclease subunit A